MGVQRRDLLLSVTSAAMAFCVTSACGQAVPPTSGLTGSDAQSVIPDFSGVWSSPIFSRLRTAGIRPWSGDEIGCGCAVDRKGA